MSETTLAAADRAIEIFRRYVQTGGYFTTDRLSRSERVCTHKGLEEKSKGSRALHTVRSVKNLQRICTRVPD